MLRDKLMEFMPKATIVVVEVVIVTWSSKAVEAANGWLRDYFSSEE